MKINKYLVGAVLAVGLGMVVLSPEGVAYSAVALFLGLAIAATLWIVKKSIIDDNRLTLDEGFSILLIHTLGILLFDELSVLI